MKKHTKGSKHCLRAAPSPFGGAHVLVCVTPKKMKMRSTLALSTAPSCGLKGLLYLVPPSNSQHETKGPIRRRGTFSRVACVRPLAVSRRAASSLAILSARAAPSALNLCSVRACPAHAGLHQSPVFRRRLGPHQCVASTHSAFGKLPRRASPRERDVRSAKRGHQTRSRPTWSSRRMR